MMIVGTLALTIGSGVARGAEPGAGHAVIEEVIVTARRKAEALQDTPLSITAFTSDMIDRDGITSIEEVALRTPGLSYGNFGDEKLSPLSLRGVIGGSGSAGADPAVGIYLDEVYLGQGVGATIDLFDLEAIEVLRGPQGTLFGRNTVGGLVHYRTARPTEDFMAYVNADFGNYDARRIAGAVSGPLGAGGVLGRLAFVSNQRDGTYDNLTLLRDVNSKDSWSVRGRLEIPLSDRITWDLSGDYRKVDQDSLVFETLSYNEASTFVAVLGAFGLPRNTDPYDRNVYADAVTFERSDAWGVTSNISAAVGAVDIVNVTSYRTHDYENRTDTDRSALQWGYDGDPEDVSRFANELRLSWTTGMLDWIAGVYYYRQDTTNRSFIELGPDLLTLFGVGPVTIDAGSDAAMNTRSVAGFGSVTWTVSDRFDISLGGRHTWEEKSIDYSQSDPLGLLGGDFAATGKDHWSRLTPSVSARYRYTPDVMGYVTVSRGFKSGGFNDALGDATGISFDPESLWSYEGGVKSTLFDGRMQANASVFYMDWKEIQITTDNPATPVFDPIIQNAGKAHTTGIELELLSRLTDRLSMGLNGSVLEAEYDEGSLPNGAPLDRIPRAPEYTFSFNAEYRAPLTGGSEWFVRGEALGRGESYLTLDNQKDGRVSPYELYNLQAGLEATDGRWRLTAWGRNIGDKTVPERLFDLSDQDVIGQKFIILNDPETYGISLRLQY
jgi:iron complex outermembrane receptor protein